jgi:hypothetical protein
MSIWSSCPAALVAAVVRAAASSPADRVVVLQRTERAWTPRGESRRSWARLGDQRPLVGKTVPPAPDS